MVLFIESKPQDIVETEMQSLSLNNVKIAGSQYLCGFPFSVLAKCLQFFDVIR